MTKIYRVLVYLVTFAIPVVIAACYGPSYRYRKGGKVLDKQSKAPIALIDVTCVVDGGWSPTERTQGNGTFQLMFDTPCQSISAVDSLAAAGDAGATDAGATDAGATDGGTLPQRTARYAPKSVPYDEAAPEIVIELDRSN